MKYKIGKAGWGVLDLLRVPGYAVPLVVNLTGSVWFFLLIGRAGECGFSLIWALGKWGRRIGRGGEIEGEGRLRECGP